MEGLGGGGWRGGWRRGGLEGGGGGLEGVDVCLETGIFWVRLLISQCGEEVPFFVRRWSCGIVWYLICGIGLAF